MSICFFDISANPRHIVGFFFFFDFQWFFEFWFFVHSFNIFQFSWYDRLTACETVAPFKSFFFVDVSLYKRLYAVFFCRKSSFECLFNKSVSAFFSTFDEFPDCNKKVFIDVYLWHTLLYRTADLHWHTMKFLIFMTPDTLK